MNARRSILFLKTLVAASAAAALCTAQAGDHDDAHASLSAQWWEWALSIPAAQNPMLDASGANCMLGQHGPVWFLAGNFDAGVPLARTCAIPAHRTLFFPIYNYVSIDTPGTCGQGASIPVSELRAAAADAVAKVATLSVTLDGRNFRQWKRVRSPVFAVALPKDNVFDAGCAASGGVPAGIYGPAVDDGYYISIDGLKKGTHALRFQAKDKAGATLQDVSYQLHVL